MIELATKLPPAVPQSVGRGTESMRVRLGSSAGTPADVLSQLTRDPAVTVRAAVAMNPACPPYVDQATSCDSDERVRALLARKLALLAPSLSGNEGFEACGQILATLSALAADTAVRVRAVIADCVKAMPDAPHGLILKLAQDTALPVSEPIIRLSPLLTDEDLLALLVAPSHLATATLVASRPGLSATVADAVAAQAESAAICALLSNRSAAIREATLEALVRRAEPHPDWHGPLVQRPALTASAVLALSGFVTAQLIEALARRANLDPAVTAELRHRVATRLGPDPAVMPSATDDALIGEVRELDAIGMLSEATLTDAARAGDQRRVAVVLAVASGLPLAAIDRATSMRSAKGLISLTWRAGFTMHAALAAQTVLAQLGPGEVMPAGPGARFPLTIKEMQWQLEVLGKSGPEWPAHP